MDAKSAGAPIRDYRGDGWCGLRPPSREERPQPRSELPESYDGLGGLGPLCHLPHYAEMEESKE